MNEAHSCDLSHCCQMWYYKTAVMEMKRTNRT